MATQDIIAADRGAAPMLAPTLAVGEVDSLPPLLKYWNVVVRWRWLILGIIGLALIAGLLATLLMTPQYTASARIEISREQKNVTNVQGVESEQVGRNLEFYQTQYALLKSRTLAERVARQMNLKSDPSFFSAHNAKLPDQQVLGEAVKSASNASVLAMREERAIAMLLEHIDISPIRGSSLVDVRYTSNSPELSAKIANVWAAQFIEDSRDRRFGSTVDARKFLEQRLNDLRGRMEQSQRDLVRYAASKNIITLPSSSSGDDKTQRSDATLASSDLLALNDALTRATADRVAAAARTQGGAGIAEAQLNPAIAALRQRRAEAAADYAKLRAQFEPGYPEAKALADQIKSLDTAISREEGRVQGSISGDYRAAVQRENQLRAQVQTLTARLSGEQQNSIQLSIYQREADTNRQLYDALLQRYKEIGVAGVAANNISVIDPAEAPKKPAKPSLPFNLALALLFGAGLAAAIVFGIEQIDEGFREPSRVSQILQVPLLGIIPDTRDVGALEALGDAKSPLFEAYLAARSNLAFLTEHGLPRSMMVTSTRPAEGKSVSACAFAQVIARANKRVLLIDADMRSPSLHTYLGFDNQAGLSNFLTGDDNWLALVHEVPGASLALVTAGPTPPNAGELLSGDRIARLIADARGTYDVIVIDSPPILGLADAPLLSRSVEGVVMVVEAGGVAARAAKQALDRLRAVHAHIFGTVLAKFPTHTAGYGYSYGYGYGYGENKDAA